MISSFDVCIHLFASQVCEYEMEVALPLACDKTQETAALKQLEVLKVFGFSKK